MFWSIHRIVLSEIGQNIFWCVTAICRSESYSPMITSTNTSLSDGFQGSLVVLHHFKTRSGAWVAPYCFANFNCDAL